MVLDAIGDFVRSSILVTGRKARNVRECNHRLQIVKFRPALYK